MKKIKQKIEEWIIKIIRKVEIDLPYRISSTLTHDLFAYIGIERIEKIIETIKKNGIDYTCLAELYSLTLRDNIESNNNDRMHAYYELLPKLDEYKKAFDLEDWQKRKNKRFM